MTGSSSPLSPALRFGQRVWTSDQLFCPGGPPGGPPGGREFCSLLNAAIRADDPGLLEAVYRHKIKCIYIYNNTCIHLFFVSPSRGSYGSADIFICIYILTYIIYIYNIVYLYPYLLYL